MRQVLLPPPRRRGLCIVRDDFLPNFSSLKMCKAVDLFKIIVFLCGTCNKTRKKKKKREKAYTKRVYVFSYTVDFSSNCV